MTQEDGEPWTDTIAYPWYTPGFVQARIPSVWILSQVDDVREQAFGNASLPRPRYHWLRQPPRRRRRTAGRTQAEEFREGRFALLRDKYDRPEVLREECRVLLDELERERWKRLEAQERVKQLMREHLERERLACLRDQRNVQRP